MFLRKFWKKKAFKVRVRIIYISWVKSYNCPYTVFNIHKCFHFKWNKFSPKYCEICKFYRISCNARMFEFYTNSQKILMQKKLELLIRLSYKRSYIFLNLFFSFHCHSFCHFSSTKGELTLLTLKRNRDYTSNFHYQKI